MSVALPPEFISLSARLGRDPLLVQGAGGNTSLKQDGVLWVKASGKWLEAASREQMFVGLDLGGVRAKLAAGESDDFKDQVLPGAEGLRPSIETSLHAALPHAVVLHVHSIRAIAWAIRADAEAQLAQLLAGLNWAFVPYQRPGLPLTKAVARATQGKPVDILILGNHGLVVGGADCAKAEALLAEVERRLDLPSRSQAGFRDRARLSQLAESSVYRLPAYDEIHALALDPIAGSFGAGGSLYPDHVVFLGSGIALIDQGAVLPTPRGDTPPPALVAISGVGVLLRNDLARGADEMALALALVLQRLPQGAPLSYLSDQDEAALLGWDAEIYRQALARQKS